MYQRQNKSTTMNTTHQISDSQTFKGAEEIIDQIASKAHATNPSIKALNSRVNTIHRGKQVIGLSIQ
jgi:hypothetical protein